MRLRGYLKILILLALTVGVICSCCSCAVASGAHKDSIDVDSGASIAHRYDGSMYMIKSSTSSDFGYVLSQVVNKEDKQTSCVEDVCDSYFEYLSDTYSKTVITREQWLSVLFEKLDIQVDYNLPYELDKNIDANLFDNSELFVTAQKLGIIKDDGKRFDPYRALTRQYLALTLTNAVGYDGYYNMSLADYSDINYPRHVCAMVYFGYLKLNENNCFNPYAIVTSDELDYILSELDTLKILKGKTVLSFGDSIMHGSGNNDEGIADLIGERYLMKVHDYSKGGATIGYVSDREQISNQILTAIKDGVSADYILINGGSNDMRKICAGKMSEDFEYGTHGRKDYASGLEYAFGLLTDNYPSVPVTYVRAHNMNWCLESNEIHFGELALDICDKWGVKAVDIYNDTQFDAHNTQICCDYTVHTKTKKNGDSVHPTRVGYYKYYLPLVVSNMLSHTD